MSSRVFQSVIVQMKEATDRVIGVIDADSNVISCSDTSLIGEKWPEAVIKLNSAPDSVVVVDKKTFKPLVSWSAYFDYAVFAEGDDETARSLCVMAYVALNGAKTYYEEKHDKGTFVKNIITDNILPGDIYIRAKELHFVTDAPRAVFLVRQVGRADVAVRRRAVRACSPTSSRTLSSPSTRRTSPSSSSSPPGTRESRADLQSAQTIEQTLKSELFVKTVIGISTVAGHLRELADAYKEAQVAIEVGKVFETEKTIINYENLGIGRLIYQLPTTLCEIFLSEVFKKNSIDTLDQETLFTINKFFENNLNVSETSRKLFVHRNTLVYRLEKIKKLTGLDLREFDDAIIFKVALMVKKYLVSRENRLI